MERKHDHVGGDETGESSKRRRVSASEPCPIFSDFPDDLIKQLAYICGHYLCWSGTHKKSLLTPLRFVNSNAADENEGIPFYRAYCCVKPANTNNQLFGSIFMKGIDILLAFFTERKLPESTQDRHVLGKMLQSVYDTALQAPLLKLGDFCDADVAVILANHLFGKLAASPKYVLDKNYENQRQKCPCGSECKITGYYGDTSIGNEDVWHGNLDIIVNQEVGVHLIEEEVDIPSCSEARTSVEVKKNPFNCLRSDKLIAETVVFSFLQKQFHPEYAHFLFPCIGVTSTALVIYFYDSEYDILLESSRIPFLASEMEISLFAILASWLVVNYKHLSSGLPETLKHKENAGFFCQAKEKIDTYRNSLKFGDVKISSHVDSAGCNFATETEFLSDARSKFLKIAFDDINS